MVVIHKRLDHIVVSPHLRPVACRVFDQPPEQGSDHYAVVATLVARDGADAL